MKVRKQGNDYELEVWMKEILQRSGRKRIDLVITLPTKESFIYRTVFEDIKVFLSESQLASVKPLPIPTYCKTEKVENLSKDRIFMLEDMRGVGYIRNSTQCKDGLDYEHSILALATLARFHACSFCYKKSKKMNMAALYPKVTTEPPRVDISVEVLSEVEEIFLKSSGYAKFSKTFLEAIKGENINSKTSIFDMFCHGHLSAENLRFKYKKQMDSKTCCIDAILVGFSECCYTSCVIDLLQLIFGGINADIRQTFLGDFVCSVYYDNFAKNVNSINKNIQMFTKKQFIKEFTDKIMYGFLFSLQCMLDANLEVKGVLINKHRPKFLALVRDIVQFKVNAKATLASNTI